MTFSLYIRQLLEKRLGSAISRPADCETLALDIESATGEHVGVNTVKRLLGFKGDEREPRLTTLDIFARYLGFGNWEELQAVDSKSNSSFGSQPDAVMAADVAVGQTVAITYLPDRRVALRRLHDDVFAVVGSANSKLLVGDEATISSFMLHYPLPVAGVRRNGQELGSLLLGKVSGLTSIEVSGWHG